MDERKEDGEVERRVCSVERRVERLVDHRRVELLPPERELRDDVPAPSDGLSAPCKTDYMMYARVACPSTVLRHKVLTADYLHPQDDDGYFHHTASTGRKARDLERSSSDL